jgi:osmotically-inducible protein OsmY
LLSLAVALPGCAPLIVGGAVAGVSAIYDRRAAQVVFDDQQIELIALHELLQDPAIQGHSGISATSYNRVVLLTGQTESESVSRRAVDRVSRLAKVQRVIDELTIGPNSDLARESEDVYLTSRAKLAMTQVDLPDFNATRIKVVTENGVVYLLGLVSPEEADAATEQVRYVPGIKRVVKLFEYR